MCISFLFGTAAGSGAGLIGAAASHASFATPGLFGTYGIGSAISGAFSALSNIGQAANAVGSLTSAYGQVYQGQVAAANMQYMAGMANYNAKVAKNNELMAKRAGEDRADIFSLKARRLLANQKVAYAKGGVVINQGTPLDVAADTAAVAEQERLAILYGAETQAGAYAAQAQQHAASQQRYLVNAANAERSGYTSALGSLASGVYTGYMYSPGRSLLA